MPKPKPPKRRRCRQCRVCLLNRHMLIHEYRTIIGQNYTREEFHAVTRASRAAMLPRDGA